MTRRASSNPAVRADDGRAELYAAESVAFEGTDIEEVVGHEAVSRLVADVTRGSWWPGPPVRVSAARSDAASSRCVVVSGGGSPRSVDIRLAAGQATVATAAHELAHALAGPEHGHDGVFRRAYLDIILIATNLDSTDRRGRLHVTQLSSALQAAGLDTGERAWPVPSATVAGPIAL